MAIAWPKFRDSGQSSGEVEGLVLPELGPLDAMSARGLSAHGLNLYIHIWYLTYDLKHFEG